MASLYDYMSPAAKKVTKKPSLTDYVKPATSKAVYSGPLQNSSKAPTKTSSKDEKKPSKKTSSKVNTSNRLLAGGLLGTPKAEGSVLGTSTSKTANVFTPKVSKPTGKLGSIFQNAVSPISNAYSNLTNKSMPDLGLSELLGLTKKEDGGLTYNTGDQPGQTINSRGEVTEVLPSNPDSPYYSTNDRTGKPISAPTPFRNITSYNEYQSNQRKPNPINTPSILSPNSPYQQPSIYQPVKQSINPQSIPEYGTTQGERGTVGRMGGRGAFSTGEFSNGQGGYGFQGNIGGGMNQEQELLNSLLGIPTANSMTPAEEAGITDPELANGYNQKVAEYDGYQKEIADLEAKLGGVGGSPSYQSMMSTPEGYQGASSNEEVAQMRLGGVNQNTTDYGNTNYETQPNVQQGSGVAQNYAQTDYNSQIKDQEKAYKAQEKAQKKALEELLKSIENQYKQTTQEGTTALDKSKQEDLLRLSGLFNFANQDPNSEQRAQYEGRMANDYSGQLANLLAKLGASRTQDISGAKQNYQTGVASLAERRAQAIQSIKQTIQERKDKMAELEWDRNYKMMALKKGGTDKKQSEIQKLLERSANMPSGGREFAQQQANILGLGNIRGYTPNGWENAYNPKFGQSGQPQLIQDENGDWYYEQ